MTENGSDSLPFEPPEQENIRLREENARLRRLLAVHSIPIPQLPAQNPPPTKTVEPPPPVDKEERARQRIALFRRSWLEAEPPAQVVESECCEPPGAAEGEHFPPEDEYFPALEARMEENLNRSRS